MDGSFRSTCSGSLFSLSCRAVYFVVGLVPECHVLSTAIYDDFGIKTLAFSENKSHSTDDGLERLKRQHCQASLSRKTCIRPLFACLIIRTFQLVFFSQNSVFLSQQISRNNIYSLFFCLFVALLY